MADDRNCGRDPARLSRVIKTAEEVVDAVGKDDNPGKAEGDFTEHLLQMMAYGKAMKNWKASYLLIFITVVEMFTSQPPAKYGPKREFPDTAMIPRWRHRAA
jgi:hypothetical protein